MKFDQNYNHVAKIWKYIVDSKWFWYGYKTVKLCSDFSEYVSKMGGYSHFSKLKLNRMWKVSRIQNLKD